MNQTVRPTGVLLAAALALATGAARAGESAVPQVRADTEWLAGLPTRVVGSPGHDLALKGLIEKVKALPGARVWTHRFPVVVPQVREATLTIARGLWRGRHRVYPLWPAGARLNTTPAGGIDRPLVYVGRARPEELPASSLRGNIAVMEMTGRAGWMSAHNAGAVAIILLGSAGETRLDFRSHLTPLSINVPRFYVPEGPLADALRNGDVKRARLFCRATWTEVTATNIYVLVRPPEPTGQKALAIGAAIDSMSVVPELAPGADAAVDVAVVLNALRRFATHPPRRPLLFAFVDAYAISQLGVRQMLAALAIAPQEWKDYREEDRGPLERYRQHDLLAQELDDSDDSLSRVHQKRYKPLHRYVKDEVDREVIQVEEQLYPLRLKLHAAAGQAGRDLREQVEALDASRKRFRGAQNRLLTDAPLDETLGELARTLWDRSRQRVRDQLAEAEAMEETHRERNRLRLELLDALGLTGRTDYPLAFLLGVDLSDAGVAVGPSLFCQLLGRNATGNSKDFRAWLSKVHRTEGSALWPGPLRRAVNLTPLNVLDAPQSHVVGDLANFTSPAQSFGTAAVTWATLDGLRLRVDTPADRADRLDWERLGPQIDATFALLARLADQSDFDPTSKVVARWRRVRGTIVDQASVEPVPRVPMKGYLTALVGGSCAGGRGRVWTAPLVAGVRRQQFCLTGTDGRFLFDVLPGHVTWYARRFFVQSFRLADDGRIVRAIDMNKVGRGVRLNVDIRSRSASPLRAVVFTCRELTGLEFFDPRFLQSLPTGSILDARRAGKPQRVNFSLYEGQMSCFLEPGTRWQLILRAGATRNRLALLNMADPETSAGLSTREAMRGFTLETPLPASPLYVAAQDFSRLDRRRLAQYRKAGINSRAIDRLRKRTQDLLDEADRAIARDDGAALFQASSGALANEIRVYQAVRDMASDVVRAAIFLLLALAPFAFTLERLLFSTPNIYRQIAGMGGIFTVMTAILWSFHPAFRISNQPLMIIMAFGIIFMSLLVIGMVYIKFESSLEEMRSGRTESSGAHTSRSGVLTSAIRLGIANMRKRILRTVLTAATVVLITFVLLCFTSTSSYVGKTELNLDVTAPYQGVLIHQPSMREMPDAALTYLQSVVSREWNVVPRYWWSMPWEPQWRIHVRNPTDGKQVSLQAALGLTAGEEKLTLAQGPAADGKGGPLLPDWDRFVGQGGCYLAREVAEALGIGFVERDGARRVRPGQTLIIAGRALELIGVFNSSRFDATVRDIDGETLLPIDYSQLGDDQRRLLINRDVEMLASAMESGAGLQVDEDLPHRPSAAVVIVPAGMLVGMRDYTLRSVGIGTGSHRQARRVALALADRLAFPVYYGSPEGVRALATTVLLPRAPGSLFIPLLIGGLIIFNTMLGSIAERQREIYVYTSIGLAPLHVGVLFLAEAVTYGLMGSIFGYIVGQGVATVFSKLGWLGGITLNYSGTQAILTMVLVMIVVILSSLIPAYMAGKLAVPSANMRWEVPRPEGDWIRDTLPFTVTGQTSNGVILFLFEYLDAHREGSIGNFSTDDLRTFHLETGGVALMGIESTVWLAPYDLGVRQVIRLTVRATDEQDVYEMDIEMHRESGQVSSWWNLNRVFLSDLRRQLLGWRKLKVERVLQYIADSAELLSRSRTPSV